MDNFSNYETPKPPIPWKLIAIIGGVVVLIVLIVLGARWFVLNKTTDGRQAAIIDKVEKQLDSSMSICDKEKNPENCKANLVEAAAMENGSVEICQKLTGSPLNTCVVKVARNILDADGCNLISEVEKQTSCKDLIYRALASQEMDISWCEKISTESVRTRCINAMTQIIAKEKGCSGTGVDQSVCDRLNAVDAAVASGDPDECKTLTDVTDQQNCFESVGSGDKDHDRLNATLEARLGTSDENVDSDNDGLSDYSEYNEYGTDPSKADTDGDGFNDGDEINNGYNPLGSGKLQSVFNVKVLNVK